MWLIVVVRDLEPWRRTLSFHPAFHHLGRLGLFEPADFTNCLLKFYGLNKSVNSEKWGPRPSTGHRNVSLLQRLTPDVIKRVHCKLRVIRAVRFNESLHRGSFLCSLIRVWSFFFFFFLSLHRLSTQILYASSHEGPKKGSSSAFFLSQIVCQAAVQEFPRCVMWCARL